MPNSFSSSGLTTATRQELLDFLTSSFQLLYGSDINLDSDTPDGQAININIQSQLDIGDLILQVNNSFDPDLAIGNLLDQRVAINGIQRQAGTYTTTNVTVTTTQSVNLYGLDQEVQDVFTAADNAGNKWFLTTTQLGLVAGSTALEFRAEFPGAIITIPNTIIVAVTIVLGLSNLNNPTSYTVLGVNEESDAQLRLRRQKSVSLSSQGYQASLLAALENINGVSSAFVYENNGSGTDGNGVPGHSIWCIVAGTPTPSLATAWSAATSYSYGQLASSGGINYISWQDNNLNNLVTDTAFWGVYSPIAQAIYSKRNAGCGMRGNVSYDITQKDGTVFTIKWDVVTAIPLFIRFTTASLNKVNIPNLSLIRSDLPTTFIPGVYEEVNINELSTLVQAIDSNTLVTVAGFGLASTGPFTDFLTPVAKNYQFVTSDVNVIMLPMLMNSSNAIPTFNGSNQVTQMNTTAASGGATIQFTGLGGYGGLTYSLDSGAGSINGSGLYTSATAGTDTVRVTDSLGNTAISVITVS